MDVIGVLFFCMTPNMQKQLSSAYLDASPFGFLSLPERLLVASRGGLFGSGT